MGFSSLFSPELLAISAAFLAIALLLRFTNIAGNVEPKQHPRPLSAAAPQRVLTARERRAAEEERRLFEAAHSSALKTV